MRLAHLTDLHLPIPHPPRPHELMSKRLLGYLSWRRNRQFRHTQGALEALAEDYRRQAVDFAAISGDLVNISLESEFSAASQWLEANFDASTSAFTPGNHDAYVRMDWRAGLGALARYMVGDRGGETREPRDPEDFPFVRLIDGVGLVFANSSPPTAPGLATGKLGPAQIERIGGALRRLGEAALCRVLVLHHPVTDDATPQRKALVDRKALRATLRDAGVELVLHGHTHRSIWAEIETKDGARPIIGGGSASHPHPHREYRPARYNLIEISGSAGEGWRIDVAVRELDCESGAVKTAENRTFMARRS